MTNQKTGSDCTCDKVFIRCLIIVLLFLGSRCTSVSQSEPVSNGLPHEIAPTIPEETKGLEGAADNEQALADENSSREDVTGGYTKETIVGKVMFASRNDLGDRGERISDRYWTAKEFGEMRGKLDRVHGLDHVRVKKVNGMPIIEVVETKVDHKNLNTLADGTRQMSDAYVKQKIAELKASPDRSLFRTGNFLERNWSRIEKVLMVHWTRSGITEIYKINGDATSFDKIEEFRNHDIDKELQKVK